MKRNLISLCLCFAVGPCIVMAEPTFYTAPLQPCEVCAHYGVVCTNQIERHHLITVAEQQKLGLIELKDDPRILCFVCDCPKHRCHFLISHGADYSDPHPQFIDMIRWIRKQPKPVKPPRWPDASDTPVR